MTKLVRYFFVVVISTTFALMFLFTTNADLRRYVFLRIAPAYNMYQIKTIRRHIIGNRDFKSAAEQLMSYINLSKKLSLRKNQMLLGIYDTVSLVAGRATDQGDFDALENVFSELIKMDPDLYMGRVWYARSISDTNYDKALLHLKRAIDISPVQEDAYREAIRITVNNNKIQEAKKYCTSYLNSQLGGSLPRDYSNYFGGSGIRHMATELLPLGDKKILFPFSGLQLNQKIEHEIVPLSPTDIKGFNLYFSFLPGIKLKIYDITLYHSDGQEKTLVGDTIIDSRSAYILEKTGDYIGFILNSGEDEIIRIHMRSPIKNVNKIIISLKVERLPISNYNICNINENDFKERKK